MSVVLYFVLLMIPITLLTASVMREEADEVAQYQWLGSALVMTLITAAGSNAFFLTTIIGLILYVPLTYAYFRIGRWLFHEKLKWGNKT